MIVVRRYPLPSSAQKFGRLWHSRRPSFDVHAEVEHRQASPGRISVKNPNSWAKKYQATPGRIYLNNPKSDNQGRNYSPKSPRRASRGTPPSSIFDDEEFAAIWRSLPPVTNDHIFHVYGARLSPPSGLQLGTNYLTPSTPVVPIYDDAPKDGTALPCGLLHLAGHKYGFSSAMWVVARGAACDFAAMFPVNAPRWRNTLSDSKTPYRCVLNPTLTDVDEIFANSDEALMKLGIEEHFPSKKNAKTQCNLELDSTEGNALDIVRGDEQYLKKLSSLPEVEIQHHLSIYGARFDKTNNSYVFPLPGVFRGKCLQSSYLIVPQTGSESKIKFILGQYGYSILRPIWYTSKSMQHVILEFDWANFLRTSQVATWLYQDAEVWFVPDASLLHTNKNAFAGCANIYVRDGGVKNLHCLGDRVKLLKLNTAFLEGEDSQEMLPLADALRTSKVFRPTVAQSRQRIQSKIEITSFPGLNSILNGQQHGEVTVLTGGVGCGKSTLLLQMATDYMTQSGKGVLWCSHRPISETLARLSHLSSTDVNIELPYSQLYPYQYDSHVNVAQITEVIRKVKSKYQITNVVVDNLQQIVNWTANYERRLSALETYFASFVLLAKSEDVHITLVVYPAIHRPRRETVTVSDLPSNRIVEEAANILILHRALDTEHGGLDTEHGGLAAQDRGGLAPKHHGGLSIRHRIDAEEEGCEKLREMNNCSIEVAKNRFNGSLADIPLQFNPKRRRFSELTSPARTLRPTAVNLEPVDKPDPEIVGPRCNIPAFALMPSYPIVLVHGVNEAGL